MAGRLVSIAAILMLLIIAKTSCGQDIGFADVENAFPQFAYRPHPDTSPIRVNIYVQGTYDMLPLLSDGSVFREVFTVLQTTAVDLWGTTRTSQHMFRFDAEWQEHRSEEGYVRTAYHFAYPLDPLWWNRPDGVPPQIPQILTPQFFQLEWYIAQNLRAPSEYERRIVESNPPFTNHERAFISRTIEEISNLRSSYNEVSVVVTNFQGHVAGGLPTEDTQIRTQILQYLQRHPDAAVGTFVFENYSNPFYILIFGPAAEVASFTNRFAVRIPVLPTLVIDETDDEDSEGVWRYLLVPHVYNLYTKSYFSTRTSTNVSSVPNVFASDIRSIELPIGVTRTFESDFLLGEAELFNHYFGTNQYFISVTGLAGSIASIDVDLLLYIPYTASQRVGIVHEIELSVLDGSSLARISHGNSSVVINELMPAAEGTLARLTINLDTTVFPSRNQRAVFALYLHEVFDMTRITAYGHYTTGLFREIFGLLANDIMLTQQAVERTSDYALGKIYLYLFIG